MIFDNAIFDSLVFDAPSDTIAQPTPSVPWNSNSRTLGQWRKEGAGGVWTIVRHR